MGDTVHSDSYSSGDKDEQQYVNELELESAVSEDDTTIHTSPLLDGTISHPLVLLAFCCLLSALTAPVTDNWTPFENILGREGVYSSLCGGQEGVPKSCEQRDIAFTALYSSVVSASYIFASLGGICLDKFGPRKTAVAGFAHVVVGFMLLSAAAGSVSSAYNAPLMLVAGGAIFSFYGFIDLARLYPGWPGFIIGLLGAFRCIGLAFLIEMDALSADGWRARTLFMLYTASIVTVLFLCWYLMPHSDWEQLLSFKRGKMILMALRKRLLDASNTEADIDGDLNQWEAFVRSSTAVKFAPFLFYFVTMVMVREWFEVIHARRSPQIENVFVRLKPWSFIVSPILGLAVDYWGPFLMMHIISACTVLVCFFQVLPVEWWDSAFMMLGPYFVLQAFVTSQWYSFVAVYFPSKFVGRLSGLALMISGISTTTLTPMFDLAMSGPVYMTLINGGFLALSIISMFATYNLTQVHAQCDPRKTECYLGDGEDNDHLDIAVVTTKYH